MSLLDEAISESGPSNGCHTCKWLPTLPPKDRAEIDAAFADPRPQHAALARVIQRHYKDAPSEYSITRHRQGKCSGTR